MKIPDATVAKLLKDAGKATAEKLAPIEEKAKAEKMNLHEAVVKANLTTETDLIKLYANEIGVPFTEINVKELNMDVVIEGIETQLQLDLLKQMQPGAIQLQGYLISKPQNPESLDNWLREFEANNFKSVQTSSKIAMIG